MHILPDRPFFILFLFLGFNINNEKNSDILSILSMIMKLIMAAIFIFEFITIYLFSHTVTQMVKEWQEIILTTGFLIKTTIIFSSYVVFQINWKNIQQILLALSQILNEKEKRKIWIFQIICLLVWIVLTNVNNYLEISVRLDSTMLVIMETLWSYNMFGWFIATQMFLTSICFSMYLVQRRIIANITQYELANFDATEDQLISIRVLVDSVNKNLGFLPFHWFCELFFSTLFRLIYITVDKDFLLDINKIMYYFSEYVMLLSLSILYLLMVSYFQSQKPTSHQLLSRITVQSRSSHVRSAIAKWDSLTDYQYKACNIFTMNIKFLFSFISSVVTFTVMFIQIINL